MSLSKAIKRKKIEIVQISQGILLFKLIKIKLKMYLGKLNIDCYMNNHILGKVPNFEWAGC